jgi:serine/threonine protein kinase
MIGKTILHYKILEKIGEGGMGVVYKAVDTKLKRMVGLKFLHPNRTRDEKAKRRFMQEARAVSSLDHPNIYTVYEIDETDKGQMFIAMAHYEGKTLKEKIVCAGTNGSSIMSVNEVIATAIQIAAGLARTHEAGIIHRDIKPANIVISDREEVKIIDFGLATLTGFPPLIGCGSTLGTVAYLAPEQSESQEIDERADIWALGVILYEMLTGQQPFQGEADQVVLYEIASGDPKPVMTLRPDVSAGLQAIVTKALVKDPDMRYQRVEEMMLDMISLRPEASRLREGRLVAGGSRGRWRNQTAALVRLSGVFRSGRAFLLAD